MAGSSPDHSLDARLPFQRPRTVPLGHGRTGPTAGAATDMSQTNNPLCRSLTLFQGFDWKGFYAGPDFPKEPVNATTLYTHGVNNGQAIKSSGVWFRQSQDISDYNSSLQRVQVLDQYHGQANGIFACDEHLAGLMPSRGKVCTSLYIVLMTGFCDAFMLVKCDKHISIPSSYHVYSPFLLLHGFLHRH